MAPPAPPADVASATRATAPTRGQRILPFLLALLAFLTSAITYRDPGPTIDEPCYMHAANSAGVWFLELCAARSLDELARVCSEENIARHWRCHDNGSHLHPPGVDLLGVAANTLTLDLVARPGASRLAGALLYGLCAAALFSLVAREHGRTAGVLAALALITLPRLFGHAHLAATDFPLAAGWLLSTQAWIRAADSKGWALALVPILALTLLQKFTAFALFAPLGLWLLLHRREHLLRYALLTAAALLLAVALDPWLWADPVGRIGAYFHQSLGREHAAPVPAYYQGARYGFALPWHNGFVLTAITVPAVTLALATLGSLCVLARRGRDAIGTLALANVALFLAARALGTPGHDGVRLFLPMFPFLAALAGIGGGALLRRLSSPPQRARAAICATAAFALYGGWQLFRLHPFQLSYYNELVGGLRGAVARGYQATYWYDALTPELYERMNEALPPGARVQFVPEFLLVPELAQSWGLLRTDIVSLAAAPAPYVVTILRQDWLTQEHLDLHFGRAGERLVVQEVEGVPLVVLARRPSGMGVER